MKLHVYFGYSCLRKITILTSMLTNRLTINAILSGFDEFFWVLVSVSLKSDWFICNVISNYIELTNSSFVSTWVNCIFNALVHEFDGVVYICIDNYFVNYGQSSYLDDGFSVEIC